MNPEKLSSSDEPTEGLASTLVNESVPRSRSNQYAELKRLIKQNGLLDRQPAYFAGKITLTFGLLAVSLTLLLLFDIKGSLLKRYTLAI